MGVVGMKKDGLRRFQRGIDEKGRE